MIRVALKGMAAAPAAHRPDRAGHRPRRRHGERRRFTRHRHHAQRGGLALHAPPTTGTDAVVSAPSAFDVDTDDGGTQPIPASRSPRASGPRRRRRRRRHPRQSQGHRRGRQARRRRPVLRHRLRRRAAGAEKVNPFQPETGRWAAGPARSSLDVGTAKKEHAGVGDRVRDRRPTAPPGPSASSASRASATSRRSVRPRSRSSTSRPPRRSSTARRGYDDILVAGQAGRERGRAALAAEPRSVPPLAVARREDQDRFTFDGLKEFVTIIKYILLAFGGIAILVGAFTIFNALSITVAQRTRELALARTIGASRRQVLRSVIARGAGHGCPGLGHRHRRRPRAGQGRDRAVHRARARSAARLPQSSRRARSSSACSSAAS